MTYVRIFSVNLPSQNDINGILTKAWDAASRGIIQAVPIIKIEKYPDRMYNLIVIEVDDNDLKFWIGFKAGYESDNVLELDADPV